MPLAVLLFTPIYRSPPVLVVVFIDGVTTSHFLSIYDYSPVILVFTYPDSVLVVNSTSDSV